MILLQITTPISVFSTCLYSSVHSRDNKGTIRLHNLSHKLINNLSHSPKLPAMHLNDNNYQSQPHPSNLWHLHNIGKLGFGFTIFRSFCIPPGASYSLPTTFFNGAPSILVDGRFLRAAKSCKNRQLQHFVLWPDGYVSPMRLALPSISRSPFLLLYKSCRFPDLRSKTNCVIRSTSTSAPAKIYSPIFSSL